MTVVADTARELAGHPALERIADRSAAPASAPAVAALDAARDRLRGPRVDAAQLTLDALAQPAPVDVVAVMELRAAELEAAIAMCHERRACPRCGAEIGERCMNLTRRASSAKRWTLKHPHRERWMDEVPER